MPWWPFNFGDNLSEQLVRIETKLDWTIKAFTDATAQSGAIDMSKLHDHLKQLADELDSKADSVIANETADETAFQDVITKLESTIDKLQKKLEDDASGGGSTGGGSGFRRLGSSASWHSMKRRSLARLTKPVFLPQSIHSPQQPAWLHAGLHGHRRKRQRIWRLSFIL
jgi:ribosome-associated translation inhibitor RaiA